MDKRNSNSITFPFEWTVKSTAYQIRYRKAFNINEVDESFCAIILAKGGHISKMEFGKLLGFYLDDLAEDDIFDVYLNGLKDYHLIEINNENIALTEYGEEAITSKLKYEYIYASAQLYENQTANGESIDFSFKNAFGIHNNPEKKRKPQNMVPFADSKLQDKLQFQLFENNIYKGKVVDIEENNTLSFNYITFELQCKITFLEHDLQINFYSNDSRITSIELLVDKAVNGELKERLIRKGKYHFILANNDKITVQNLRTYNDFCDWRALAENSKIDWGNPEIFEEFKQNGDGGIWKKLSENVPIENIKTVIEDFEEYWNWTVLSQRLDNGYIKDKIHRLNWDFEELSHKDIEFVIDLLSISSLKDLDWDWTFLSKHLPDDFIEENILKYNWDFYVITTNKNEIFKNVFRKYRNNLLQISEKSWNWKYISEEININFLYYNIYGLASKIVWSTVLNRFFSDKQILAKSLNDNNLKSILKRSLPGHYRISDQQFKWSLKLIDFLEELNLINWETKSYIKGLDSNEGVDWNQDTFIKYKNKITTEIGFANVSKHISDPSLLERFPDFSWNWSSISINDTLIDNYTFIERAISGEAFYTDELLWSEILTHSSYDVNFWNKKLQTLYDSTNSEKNSMFWKLLTQQEETEFIFSNPHYPWDWSLVTNSASTETILDSLENEALINNWDWRIATQKFDKETVLENLEGLAYYIHWSFVLNEVFSPEDELRLNSQLPRIAACLSVLEEEKRREYWKDLTAVYPFPQLFEYVAGTHKLELFEWDWRMISNHNHFPTDLRTLNRFKESLNWQIFSGSNAMLKKFDFNNWDNFGEWFKSTDTYLLRFSDKWDWKVLSQNIDLTHNGAIVEKFKDEEWDWEYLSEYGNFLKNPKKGENLQSLLKQFPKIKFGFLSKRTDIDFDSYLIQSTKDKDLNWHILSENHKVEITSDLLLELKDKDWNWKALSQRTDIELSNEILKDLLNKEWDWQLLSQNKDLEFNAEFIEQTKSKPWDWRLVSHHKSFFPTVEILTLAKNFNLDWEYLSNLININPTRELLSKFEDKWNWYSITRNEQLDFSDTDFLQRFVDRWDWSFICESGNLGLDNNTLALFKNQLEWDLISANTSINFTQEIIQEFRQYWNWTKLGQNKRVEELLDDYIANEIESSATLSFLDKIEQQFSSWKGSIYHFTHIDNAVEIIKNRNIQSRNRATIKGDAAGNVVHRRGDAHDYARFYFRPQTPTQFYNEFLGRNITDRYYDKARKLGFPKCPLPIFFRFSLKEVLFKNEKKCCVSNGNMQKTSTRFDSIEQMLNKFNFQYLYSDINDGLENYMNYAQQEYLVKDELTFNDLVDFEIVCPSDADRNLLISLLGEEQKEIFSKIAVDLSYYNQENPRIKVEENETDLRISTNFNGDGYFVLNGSNNMSELRIISGDLNSIDDNKIIFKSNITIENNLYQDLTLQFIDESDRNWFVYNKYKNHN